MHTQFNHLGMQQVTQGEYASAITNFEQAIRLNECNPDYHANLGLAFLLAGKPFEAVVSLRAALDCQPFLPVVWGYLGAAYSALDDCENALHFLLRSLYEPSTFVLRHLSLVYHRLGRFYEAKFYTESLLTLNPDDEPAHFNRGILLLTTGDFDQGWDEFEWRTKMVEVRHRDIARDYGIPHAYAWDGRDISDQHLLVAPEAGIGDAVQFCRFIPDLAARCRRLSVYERPGLRGLLRVAYPDVNICEDVPPDVDTYMLSMGAGRLLRLHPGIIDRGAYLRAVERHPWHLRLAHLPKPRVGLVWAGQPDNPIDARRSLTLQQLMPLLRLNVSWVSLQMNRPERVCPMYDAALSIHDWTDTAGAIDALDLVITVDTAVAHVAGAMGKPVWLLNRFDTDWRWGMSGERTPWYASMRIFRQPSVGNWLPVIEAIAAELRNCFAGHAQVKPNRMYGFERFD